MIEKGKKVIFLSMRMNGRDIKDIIATRNKMIDSIKVLYPDEELGFVDNIGCEISIAPDMLQQKRLLYLGEAIKKMAYCNMIAVIYNDMAYGPKHGCTIEENVATEYDFEFIRLNETPDGAFYPDLNKKWRDELHAEKQEPHDKGILPSVGLRRIKR